MRNITFILVFVLGAVLTLSAQRGTIISNPTSGNNNQTIRNTNTANRGGSNYTRPSNNNTANRGGGSNYGRGNDNRGNNNANRGGSRPGSRHGHNNHNTGYGHNNGHGHTTHHSGHGHHDNNHYGHHNNHHNNHYSHTTTYHSGHGYGHYTAHGHGWNAVCATDFNRGCYTISSCGFDSDRLRSAKRFANHNHLTSDQVRHIMGMFSFESTRLDFAKYAFNRTCDIENYYLVFDGLHFNSSRRDLDHYINHNCF